MTKLLKGSGLVLGLGFSLGLDPVFISGSKLNIRLNLYLVVGLGLGLCLDTVFISGLKLSIQSGYVLGLGYGLVFGHGFSHQV